MQTCVYGLSGETDQKVSDWRHVQEKRTTRRGKTKIEKKRRGDDDVQMPPVRVDIVCSQTPGTIWCALTGCEAIFRGLDLRGAISRVSSGIVAYAVASREKQTTTRRATT